MQRFFSGVVSHYALFAIAFLLLSLGQLTAMYKSGGFNVYLFDIFIIGTGILLSTKGYLDGNLLLNKSHFLFLVFILLGLSSLVWNTSVLSSSELISAGFYAIRFVGYLLFSIYYFSLYVRRQLSLKILTRIMLTIYFIFCLIGFLQLVFLPDFTKLDATLGWDPHMNRLTSTFLDPNFAGAFIVSGLVITYYAVQNKYITRKSAGLFLVCFTLSIVLTFSRSTWLMLSVFVMVLGIMRHRKLLFIALLVAFLAYFAVPRIQTRLSGITDPADSASFRLISWKNTIEIIYEHPALGVGFNAFRHAQERLGKFDVGTQGGNSGAGSDSSLLFVLSTVGPVGFLVYVVALFNSLFKKDSALHIGLFLGLLAHSLFVNSLFYPPILFLILNFYIFDISTGFDSSRSL